MAKQFQEEKSNEKMDSIKLLEMINNQNEHEFWLWCNKKRLTPDDIVKILSSVKLINFIKCSQLEFIPTERLVDELEKRNYNRD